MNRNQISGYPGTAGRTMAAGLAIVAGIAVFSNTAGLVAQQAPATAAACVVTGTITGLGAPLPGVSLTVRRGETVQTATSTDMDGNFRITLPDSSYQVSAELTGFELLRRPREITPRVVRNLTRPEARLEEFSGGTEASLGTDPVGLPPAAPVPGAPAASPTPGAPRPAAPAGAAMARTP